RLIGNELVAQAGVRPQQAAFDAEPAGDGEQFTAFFVEVCVQEQLHSAWLIARKPREPLEREIKALTGIILVSIEHQKGVLKLGAVREEPPTGRDPAGRKVRSAIATAGSP